MGEIKLFFTEKYERDGEGERETEKERETD
jgi:hypothetical protein